MAYGYNSLIIGGLDSSLIDADHQSDVYQSCIP